MFVSVVVVLASPLGLLIAQESDELPDPMRLSEEDENDDDNDGQQGDQEGTAEAEEVRCTYHL